MHQYDDRSEDSWCFNDNYMPCLLGFSLYVKHYPGCIKTFIFRADFTLIITVLEALEGKRNISRIGILCWFYILFDFRIHPSKLWNRIWQWTTASDDYDSLQRCDEGICCLLYFHLAWLLVILQIVAVLICNCQLLLNHVSLLP